MKSIYALLRQQPKESKSIAPDREADRTPNSQYLTKIGVTDCIVFSLFNPVELLAFSKISKLICVLIDELRKNKTYLKESYKQLGISDLPLRELIPYPETLLIIFMHYTNHLIRRANKKEDTKLLQKSEESKTPQFKQDMMLQPYLQTDLQLMLTHWVNSHRRAVLSAQNPFLLNTLSNNVPRTIAQDFQKIEIFKSAKKKAAAKNAFTYPSLWFLWLSCLAIAHYSVMGNNALFLSFILTIAALGYYYELYKAEQKKIFQPARLIKELASIPHEQIPTTSYKNYLVTWKSEKTKAPTLQQEPISNTNRITSSL